MPGPAATYVLNSTLLSENPPCRPDGQLQGLLAHFFGVNGSKKLQVRDFSKFLARLHEELLKLEFGHYDEGGKGSLHPVDFARSLVVAACVKSVDGLLNKVRAEMGDAVLELHFVSWKRGLA